MGRIGKRARAGEMQICGWGRNSGVESLPNMLEAQGLIPRDHIHQAWSCTAIIPELGNLKSSLTTR